MASHKINCEVCDFEGTLRYSETEFTKADIAYCPCCGTDISEQYNVADGELD